MNPKQVNTWKENAELPARFRGDGRFTVVADPQDVIPGTHPIRVTRRGACKQCASFREHKLSNHSGQGATLWVLMELCRTKGIKYQLQVHKDLDQVIGYTMTFVDEES